MSRQYGLDLARLMAALFVAFGHLAFGGTFATDDAYRQWTMRGESLPLLDKDQQILWWYDYYMLVHWQTSAGILGVGLFFVISGWVVPPMLKRYNRSQFLLNRVYRIFPMLTVSVLVAAAIQYGWGNREALHWTAVLSTMFLANDLTGQPMTLGVVWTLIVEFKFYLLLALFGKLTQPKILMVAAAISGLYGIYVLLLFLGFGKSQVLMVTLANAGLRDLHYIVLMLIASSFQIALAQKQPWYWRAAPVLVVIAIFNLLRWILVKKLEIHPWQDINIATQLAIYPLFVGCLLLQKRGADSMIAHWIKGTSDITYSLYLLHLSIGILLMSVLRHRIDNQYVLVFTVIAIVCGVSYATFHAIEKRFRYRAESSLQTTSRSQVSG